MANSSIEWTELTWNPTTGCDKISAGCKFCYAEVMSRRLKAMKVKKYSAGFKIKTHESALDIPYTWKKPAMVFVNSMSDLFHKDVPLEYIQRVFTVMNECQHLTFQVLTKRSERLSQVADKLNWSRNIWMGVSVENSDVIHRIDQLRNVPAAVRFLSCEPLIGPLSDMNLKGVDWVIVGGESGHNPRQMDKDWALDIRDQCEEANVSFFFKQWGGRNKKAAGRELEGEFYDAFPIAQNRDSAVA